MDDGISEAIQTGERNREIINLLEGWCSHISVQRSPHGGIGLVEIETGLPIGMREISCPHAKKHGWAGMNMQALAFQFYDLNCKGCPKRDPVRILNISSLIADRDAHLEQQEAARKKATEEQTRRLELRKQARSKIRNVKDAAQMAVIDALDRLDQEPNDQNQAYFVETAQASGKLTTELEAAAMEAANLGGYFRTEGCLKVLDKYGQNRKEIVKTALGALARGEAHDLASSIVDRELSSDLNSSLVQQAVGTLIYWSAPQRLIGMSTPEPRPTHGLKKISTVYPQETKAAFFDFIKCDEKNTRIAAFKCLRYIASDCFQLVKGLLEDVCLSVQLPDDHYDGGSAAQEAAQTLAECLKLAPQEIDTIIQDSKSKLPSHAQGNLIHVYVTLLGDWWREGHEPAVQSGDAFTLSYERLIEILSSRTGDKSFEEAVKYFEWVGDRCPFNVDRVTSLIGIAVLLSQDLKSQPRSSILDIRPDPIRDLELETKRMALERGLRAATNAISGAANRAPLKVIPDIQKTFESLNEDDSKIRSALIECLKGAAKTENARATLLPFLYRAMMDRSVPVRYAAIEVAEKVIGARYDDLPEVFFDCIIALLTDRYVVVHSRALYMLEWTRLPRSHSERALSIVWAWIATYANSHSDDEVLASAINAALSLSSRLKIDIQPKTNRAILSILTQMHSNDAYRVLERNNYLLGVDGCSAFIIKLFCDPKLYDNRKRDLLHTLPSLNPVEAAQNPEAISAAARVMMGRGAYETVYFIDLLSRAQKWAEAKVLAKELVSRFEDNQWNKEIRKTVLWLQAAVESETAVIENSTKSNASLAAWNKIVEGKDV